jgi:alanine racemase
MNMMMVDVTHIEHVNFEDEVILIGKHPDSDEEITSAQLAEWSDTIHYEAVTRLHQDIPRFILPTES